MKSAVARDSRARRQHSFIFEAHTGGTDDSDGCLIINRIFHGFYYTGRSPCRVSGKQQYTSYNVVHRFRRRTGKTTKKNRKIVERWSSNSRRHAMVNLRCIFQIGHSPLLIPSPTHTHKLYFHHGWQSLNRR